MKIIMAYPEKCAGYRECQVVCSLTHTGTVNPHKSGINIVRHGVEIDLPVVCVHGNGCELECIAACPEDAISQNEEEVVVIDHQKCTGCGECVKACPYHAIQMAGGLAYSCDLCGPELPECIKVCTQGGIRYAEADVEHIKAVYSTIKEG
jgi:Fe-S-cluster-containing hydrogenase component 2